MARRCWSGRAVCCGLHAQFAARPFQVANSCLRQNHGRQPCGGVLQPMRCHSPQPLSQCSRNATLVSCGLQTRTHMEVTEPPPTQHPTSKSYVCSFKCFDFPLIFIPGENTMLVWKYYFLHFCIFIFLSALLCTMVRLVSFLNETQIQSTSNTFQTPSAVKSTLEH